MTARETMFIAISGLSLFGVVNAADERSLEHISGALYQVHAGGNYHSALLNTAEGIIVFDPVNRDAATWLDGEIKRQFDKPVKYLIYSHSDADHSSGGEVFSNAVVIGHEKTKAAMIRSQSTRAIPDITFSDQMTVELGGEAVNLQYLGEGHGDNLSVIHFPNQRAVLLVDVAFAKRLAYGAIGQSPTAPPTSIPGWIEGLHRVESIDYDIFLPGHGNRGTKEDAVEFRRYFEALYAAVFEAKSQGVSLEDAKANIRLEQFSHLGMYNEWLALNVEGVYELIELD